jgi:hypothetical protein
MAHACSKVRSPAQVRARPRSGGVRIHAGEPQKLLELFLPVSSRNCARFRAFALDSDRLHYQRTPEFRGRKPKTARILRSSILGTPLFNGGCSRFFRPFAFVQEGSCALALCYPRPRRWAGVHLHEHSTPSNCVSLSPHLSLCQHLRVAGARFRLSVAFWTPVGPLEDAVEGRA